MIFNVVSLILAGIVPGLLHCGAAPRALDQSQTGEFNVNTKLENFLIIFAPTSGIISTLTGLASNLATGGLEFSKHASRNSVTNEKSKEPNEAIVYETEEINHGREPYRVEIIHIEKEREDSGKKNVDNVDNVSDKKSKTDSEVSSKNAEDPEKNRDEKNSSNDNKKEKKVRSIWRHEEIRELVDNLEKGRQKEKSVKKTYKIENLEQTAESLSIKEENLKSTKPGISLKKQLSRKEDEDVSLMSSERNDVEIKPLELKLLGGGIENCGPGRYRDRSGVCQFDKSFN